MFGSWARMFFTSSGPATSTAVNGPEWENSLEFGPIGWAMVGRSARWGKCFALMGTYGNPSRRLRRKISIFFGEAVTTISGPVAGAIFSTTVARIDERA